MFARFTNLTQLGVSFAFFVLFCGTQVTGIVPVNLTEVLLGSATLNFAVDEMHAQWSSPYFSLEGMDGGALAG
jgi:hypothetical protein